MTQTKEITLMDLAITDTAAHNSTSLDARVSDKQAFYLVNTLNQDCSNQLQVSGDKGANWKDIGSPVVVIATTGIDWIVNSEAYPHLRIKATCSIGPTSGKMTVTGNAKTASA